PTWCMREQRRVIYLSRREEDDRGRWTKPLIRLAGNSGVLRFSEEVFSVAKTNKDQTHPRAQGPPQPVFDGGTHSAHLQLLTPSSRFRYRVHPNFGIRS